MTSGPAAAAGRITCQQSDLKSQAIYSVLSRTPLLSSAQAALSRIPAMTQSSLRVNRVFRSQAAKESVTRAAIEAATRAALRQ